MSPLKSAIVAGHLCLDFIPNLENMPGEQLSNLLQPGRLTLAGPATISTGGSASNTGLALHILGIPTRLIAKVGADPLGAMVRELVGRYDPALADGIIASPEAATSYTVILNPPGVDRAFLHCAGANESFGAEDIDYELVSHADLFHFGYPPIMRRMYSDGGLELTEMLRRCKSGGATTSVDMTFPDSNSEAARVDWHAILRRALPYVDIFLPSVEEMLFMVRRETYQAMAGRPERLLDQVTPELLSDLAQELLGWGAKIVGLKLGHRGLYLRTATGEALSKLGRGTPADLTAWANQELWAPCFQVKVAGTTGSGDATVAGFIAGVLRGLSPAETVTAAVAVGACNVEAPDATSGLRPWEATLARVAAGWPRHTLEIHAEGWSFDALHGLWIGPAQMQPDTKCISRSLAKP